MVSRNEVISAYRGILGRSPESEEVIISHLRCDSLEELLSKFLSSPEFTRSTAGRLNPLEWPAIEVEVDTNGQNLNAMLEHVNATWSHLGATEPHWSVLTHPEYKPEVVTQNKEKFFASGQRDVKVFQAFLQRNRITFPSESTCFELGCGVGRVTFALAPLFRKVIAADVSGNHLMIASETNRKNGVENISFFHVRSLRDIQSIPSFNVFYSIIVLQHNPPPVISYILRAVLQRLARGGIAFFQIPTYCCSYNFEVNEYLQNNRSIEMEMHLLPQEKILDIIYATGCKLVEIREDDFTGMAQGVSNTFLVRKHGESH